MIRQFPFRIAGWSALALYLVAYAPAGLGVAALVGSFDGRHQVQVRAGESGAALVLHHGRDCAVHRHGAIARVLTCFAQRASNTDPDHVIQFSAADTLSPNGRFVSASLQGSLKAFGELPGIVAGPPADAWPHPALPVSAPGANGPARCLRSTVLLI